MVLIEIREETLAKLTELKKDLQIIEPETTISDVIDYLIAIEEDSLDKA